MEKEVKDIIDGKKIHKHPFRIGSAAEREAFYSKPSPGQRG